MAIDTYQAVTDRIIELLEQGVVPWRNPILGSGGGGWPHNLVSDQPYRGINVFLLALTAWEKGYGSKYWVTYKQAAEKGGHVKKGEKSTLVIFYKQLKVEDDGGANGGGQDSGGGSTSEGETKSVPMIRHYRVFNVEQCEGVEKPDVVDWEPIEFTPIQAAEQLVSGYADGPKIERHGLATACYRPGVDAVLVPVPERFQSVEAYYATLFHELAHSTGHSSRLDRGLDTDTAPFGSPDYGKEELVAEMAAAFLCSHCGIEPATIDQTAAYLQGWLKQLKQDKKLVVQSASAAQRAAEWVRGQRGR